MFNVKNCAAAALLLTGVAMQAALPEVEMKLAGDRKVAVTVKADGKSSDAVFEIPASEVQDVKNERYDKLRIWAPNASGWQQQALLKTKSQECNTPQVYVPGTIRVAAGRKADAKVYERGKDFEINENRGTFGRLEGGAIPADERIYVSYSFAPQRIDSVVLKDGKLELLAGVPHVTTPKPPVLADGQIRVGNILTRGSAAKLAERDLYPIRETAFPGPTASDVAEKQLPKTMAKLRSGEPLTILAWGDSVTGGGFIPRELNWQEQFVARLKERFPKADIKLVTVGWGGHNTNSFLYESKDTPFDYIAKVAGSKADLVVSEFVNDGWMNKTSFDKNYNRILKDFRDNGYEWIALTPHYVGGMAEQPEDSRAYVKMLREFGGANNVPVADGSARYGRLHLQGLSYPTLMANGFNHPDDRGMAIFADALIALFPEK